MYQVININSELEFTGKGNIYTMTQALDLYDSLGGNAKGFKVVKI
jgi:hypothetical protein